jgi:Ni2+-binding GTPase involved in maturation of urease and hydrogenase
MRAAGCRVVQVNTGTGCHLDAVMVRDALAALDPPPGSVVVIENVGNLVCPALFDLGEAHRVVLASVTEGADKPVKYPHMFRSAGLVLVSKTDLLPYLDFDLDRCTADLGKISPGATVLPVSARAGRHRPVYDWLRQRTRPRASLDGMASWEEVAVPGGRGRCGVPGRQHEQLAAAARCRRAARVAPRGTCGGRGNDRWPFPEACPARAWPPPLRRLAALAGRQAAQNPQCARGATWTPGGLRSRSFVTGPWPGG